MMVEAKNYKGIEFVQVSDLPAAQQERMKETMNSELFIKILIDGKIINNCLQYKDYSYWYNSVYRPQSVQPQASPSPDVEFQTNLAFKQA